jgi:hypothetical protein
MKLLTRASRRLAAGVAVASAAILLPAAALAAPPTSGRPAQHAAAAAPRCKTGGQFGTFAWLGLPGNGSAGHVTYELEVSNTSHHACTLRGVPRIVAVRNGHQVGRRVRGSRKGPLVTLQPGATAHADLTVGDAGAVCAHPVTAEVVIYLPRQSQAQQPGDLTAKVCRHRRGGGVLGVGTIHAGTGIPFFTP